MRFLFSKLQATGNDFIVVDNRVGQYPTCPCGVRTAERPAVLQLGLDGHHYKMVDQLV